MCAAVTKIVFFAPSANFLLTHYAWPSVIEAWCGRSGRLDLPKAHLNLYSCYLPAHIQCFTRVNSCGQSIASRRLATSTHAAFESVEDLGRAAIDSRHTSRERVEFVYIYLPKAEREQFPSLTLKYIVSDITHDSFPAS
jgi:hypothetical protein